jgi:permuted papain-like amidase YaeF/Yiix C92 family enzyme
MYCISLSCHSSGRELRFYVILDTAKLRGILRSLLVGSLLGAVLLLAVAIVLRSFGEIRTQVLFTLLGMAAGAILGDIGLGALSTMPIRAKVSLASTVFSQAWYYLIVWTRWKMDPSLWRFWWICMVASVTSAHLLAIGKGAAIKRDWVGRVTSASAAAAGLLLASLGLRKDLPPDAGPLFLWVFGIVSAISTLGSIVLWWRWTRRSGSPQPMARWARISWILGSHAALFMAGWYIGGAGADTKGALDLTPAALAGLKEDQIDALVRTDLEKLKTVVSGLDDLTKKAGALHATLSARRKAENREVYTPEEDDQIRWHFVTYLSLRSVLRRLAGTYACFESVRSPELRARCFMVGYAAAAQAFEKALTFLSGYGQDPLVARKLDEKEPIWGLQAGMLSDIRTSVTNSDNLDTFQEMGALYEESREHWRASGVWSEADFAWLDGHIGRSVAFVRANSPSRPIAWFQALAKRVKEDTYKPIYAAQSMLSCMIGDLKIVKDPPFITIRQIKEQIQPKLRPGDIFLERRNWFMSNAFLPGFWPHSALYIGTIDDLKRLGIADHPEVRARLVEYLKKAPDDEPHTVLESVSEGVVFNSITESMHADYVAVLRPRLTDAQVAQAIVKAFSHQGKPYDFEFDFFTSDKLVCTELVYRSYEGLIHFDLIRVMGRDTLPALEIAKKFAKERGTEQRQFDLVLFVDGDGVSRSARLASEEDFCGTITRQRAFTQ